MSERTEKIRDRLREIASRAATPVEVERRGVVVEPGETFFVQSWAAPDHDLEDEGARRRAGVEALVEVERQRQERRDAD